MRIRRTMLLTASVAAASALALAGCASADGGSVRPLSAALAAAVAAPPVAAVATTKCKDGQNQVASLAPGNVTTDWRTAKSSPTMQNIQKNHYLTVGTSGDVLLWGATDPATGNLQGFDIDLLAQVARYAGVDPAKTNYHVINYGARLTALKAKTVDIVAHTMTINCDRWQGTGAAPNAINFSSEYYRAGQRVLVGTNFKGKTIQALKGQTICVPSASTNLTQLQSLNQKLNLGLNIVALDVVGDCLVKFQEGEVTAITGDDTVLAGFVAQDPYAKMIGPQFSEEPYGLGINADDPVFTQFVNAVLEKLRADGTLAKIYNDTMGKAVPGVPTVPQPVYGRTTAALQRKP